MYGTYYKTLSRNEYTGETKFLFAPTEPCEEAIDGMVTCVGRIGIYVYRMPLKIDGYFKEHIFYIEKEYLPSEREEDVIRILELFTNELTESNQKNIASLCKGDIFSFVKRADAKPQLLKVLSQNSNKNKIVDCIIKKAKKLSDSEELIKDLITMGVSADRIDALINCEVNKAILRQSPYLTCLYSDISIYSADMIAQCYCNIKPYAPIRIVGYIYDAIQLSTKSGNTCITLEKILKTMNTRSNKSIFKGKNFSISMVYYGISLMDNMISIHYINGKAYVYENRIWEEETSFVSNLHRLQNTKEVMVTEFPVKQIEEEVGFTYNKEQVECLQLLKTSGVKILTGPPGVGKTATIRLIIRSFMLAYPKKKVFLSATTGRAAQVMKKACNMPTKTVNKMLDVKPYDKNISGKNINNQLDADLIIVDEISMLGLQLGSLLMKAIKTGSIVLFVGDENQLQSVEYGNLLRDLINSGKIETYRLTEVMRQSGAICENASIINTGNDLLCQDETFRIYDFHDMKDAKEHFLNNLPSEKFQVLSSVKRGELGTYRLNSGIQDRCINDKKLCLQYGNTNFYEGDRVIMLQTNYEKGYFNGDMGIITSKEEEGILVKFQDSTILLDRNDYFFMTLSYAITAHKSQGSEFEDVYVILPKEPKNMLTRRILYTAITRAKKRVTIYSIDHSYLYAIGNKSERSRMTLLADRLYSGK